MADDLGAILTGHLTDLAGNLHMGSGELFQGQEIER